MKTLFALGRWAFGGSVGYIQGAAIIGLVGFIGYHWISYHRLQDENKELKQDKAWLEIEAGWKDQIMAGFLATNTRRDTAQAQQLTVEDIINAMPETNYCGTAPAITAALASVSDRRGTTTTADP